MEIKGAVSLDEAVPDQGLSQYQLADLANNSRSQIMGIEKGTINPSLCTLNALADGLGITLPELVEVG